MTDLAHEVSGGYTDSEVQQIQPWETSDGNPLDLRIGSLSPVEPDAAMLQRIAAHHAQVRSLGVHALNYADQ